MPVIANGAALNDKTQQNKQLIADVENTTQQGVLIKKQILIQSDEYQTLADHLKLLHDQKQKILQSNNTSMSEEVLAELDIEIIRLHKVAEQKLQYLTETKQTLSQIKVKKRQLETKLEKQQLQEAQLAQQFVESNTFDLYQLTLQQVETAYIHQKDQCPLNLEQCRDDALVEAGKNLEQQAVIQIQQDVMSRWQGENSRAEIESLLANLLNVQVNGQQVLESRFVCDETVLSWRISLKAQVESKPSMALLTRLHQLFSEHTRSQLSDQRIINRIAWHRDLVDAKKSLAVFHDYRQKVDHLAFTMKAIDAGAFIMGNASGEPDEMPVHKVTVERFYLAETETTWELYQACIDAAHCQNNQMDGGDNGWGKEDRPVIEVSFQDITEDFIPWLNTKTKPETPYRLPSEAEWEYAARAGSQLDYAFGSHVKPNLAHCAGCDPDNKERKSVAVATFPANAFGLYDMHGNVWEWTKDCWHNTYNGAPNDGSAWLSGDCGKAVARGGSWLESPRRITSSYRENFNKQERSFNLGFRLARDAENQF